MQVFKTFFKVISKNIWQIMIYFFVFFAITLMLIKQGDYTQTIDLENKKVDAVIFNLDKNTKFINSFKEYLKKYINIKQIENTKEDIQDALYYNEVQYIITIPNGFSDNLINRSGENIQIEKMSVAGANTSALLDFAINKYMNAANTYINTIPNISEESLNEYLKEDMNLKSEYIINNYGKTSGNSDIQIYYRYYAYVAFAVLILGITSVMLSFNNLDLRRRNLASPIKNINYNMQIILGSLVFTILVWFVITLISIFIYGLEVVTSKSILLVLNAFVVSFAALSLSFFVGNFIKSKGAQSAVATILSLGLCFLSGVFVPQEFMSSSVLKISSFTPTYWYVKAVNDIGELTVFSSENILPIVYSMLIQLGFALAILLISLILVRQKRTSSQ